MADVQNLNFAFIARTEWFTSFACAEQGNFYTLYCVSDGLLGLKYSLLAESLMR